MPTTQKATARTTKAAKSAPAFTDEERAAMKERAEEVKASKRRGKGSGKEADAKAVLDKIAEMPDEDRVLAEGVHRAVADVAPDLASKLWYGQPAYTKDGKVICFFQPAAKFKARYSTLGFNDTADLDSGTMWPTSFALTEWNEANEKKIRTLVKKAAR